MVAARDQYLHAYSQPLSLSWDGPEVKCRQADPAEPVRQVRKWFTWRF
jgi:hypothetical protein